MIGSNIINQSAKILEEFKENQPFPHVAHRVVHQSTNAPSRTGLSVTAAEKDVHGVYYAAIQYIESHPGSWQVASADQ